MNLKERFKKEMIPVIQERLGLTNVNAVPKVTKVVINMGVGEAVNDKKHLESAVNDLTAITGQKPVVTKARKSVASFKIRDGWPLGCKVTRVTLHPKGCLLYTSPSPRDQRGSRMPSSA